MKACQMKTFAQTQMRSKEECDRCNGTGLVKCRNCGGHGSVNSGLPPSYHTCSVCDGSGEVECPNCDGKGYVWE